MKYFFLSLVFSLFAISGKAQEYSCLSPEYKTFFTNGDNYLRGMRIDSIKPLGSSKIFFPFKTARVGWYMDGQYADTSGGSWLGELIIEDTVQGISFIPTQNGDTVKIKNNAALNETWTFYQDTASRYYEATVIALDTATFAGIFDSVKIIQINAKEGNNIITADSLNGLKIILSKDHGFFQVCGLYLFPFGDPNLNNADYYLHLSIGTNYALGKKKLLTFKRVPYEYPTNQVIYDFNVGDFFASTSSYAMDIQNYDNDNILSKSASDTSFSYQVHYYSYGHSGPTTHSSNGTITWHYAKGFLIDSTKMPEEWYNANIYHYVYQDSSFCLTSNLYQTDPIRISMSGQLINFEAGQHTRIYKEQLGLINEYWVQGDAGPEFSPITFYLYQAEKAGNLCDAANNPLGINDLANPTNSRLTIYPNPVGETLNITLKSSVNGFTVCLYDLTGRIVTQKFSREETMTLNVGSFSQGLYFLKVTSDGSLLTRKINIIH